MHPQEGVLIFVIILISRSSGFNIATSSNTLSTFTPASSGEVTQFNPENPAFYGYDVTIRQPKPTPTDPTPSFDMFVGAPKTVNPDYPDLQDGPATPSNQGNIQACKINFKFRDGTYCESVTPPPDSGPGDSYGLSVKFPNDGNQPKLVACSPTKSQVCGPNAQQNFNSPGFCYRSSDLGVDWHPDPRTAELSCNDFNLDLIFVIDGSGSVGKDFPNIIKWIKDVSTNFVIADGSTRIGVIQFSIYIGNEPLDKQPFVKNEIELGSIRNQEDLAKALDKITLQGYNTDTAAAIDLTALDFKNSPRFDWANTSKVSVLLTDGRASDADKLPAASDALRALNVTTFAIGVGDARKSELRTIATGNQSSEERVYSIDNYDGLKGITQNLKKAITAFALEGASSSSDKTVQYELQLAEYGFSLQPSKLTSPARVRMFVGWR